jgi:hypothetical protein
MADGRALSNWLLFFSFDCISNKGLIGVQVHWQFHPYLVFSRFPPHRLTETAKLQAGINKKVELTFHKRVFGEKPLSKLTIRPTHLPLSFIAIFHDWPSFS